MDFTELVREARSIRRFDSTRRIPEGTLLSLIDLARMTPCAGNLQRIRYLPVERAEDAAELTRMARFAAYYGDWAPAENEFPAAYLLMLSDAASAAPAIDIGISAEVILLGAAERGIGGCMLANIDREAIARRFGIGEEVRIDLAIALGYPAETVRLTDAVDGEIKYYRNEADEQVVPKRPLSELLYRPIAK